MTFKSAIETEMEKIGINRAELARRSGCAKSTITAILNDDEDERVKGLLMGTCDNIAAVFNMKGYQLWRKADAKKDAK